MTTKTAEPIDLPAPVAAYFAADTRVWRPRYLDKMESTPLVVDGASSATTSLFCTV